ncbi:phosphate ABC transporter substrate-binding protein PstS [Gemmata sp. JC717]|uniref:phosphate ABC transporter substrate-binding protein PstS n=1 Tax=Gemmata algarum TaxID=2975278 RepID=UPI0021BB99F1|nr:phosphate ABC transporter substrate-binding protein PstS [Gemmata algarum]MDY3553343.1 phosphate ABC transporter substrate-binding protein PstS [Gemmata algarum]
MRSFTLVPLALVAAIGGVVLVSGCGKSDPRVSAGGATFVDPIMQKWAAEYKGAKKVEVDYVAKGSGYGITNVTGRMLDFGCSDAPMNATEVKAANEAGGEVVHVPVTVGAVAVIYHLPEVPGLKLSGEVIADIYLGKIKQWDAPAIKALNPGVNLPGTNVVFVYRAESSGTTNIFTEYLSKRSAEFAKAPGTSKSPKWPAVGVGKEGNDGVAEHVKNTAGAIGYVELAYAKKNNITFAALTNKANKPVAPDAASVTAAVESAMKVKADREPYTLHPLTFSFTDAEGDAAYPIVGASYAILFKKLPKEKGPAVVEFLKWAVADGQQYAKDLDYAPLPAELTKKAQELLGTVTFE